MSNTNWLDNSIQFPRLIAEADEAGAFTREVIEGMAESMDLETSEVCELIERAQHKWDEIKRVACPPHPPKGTKKTNRTKNVKPTETQGPVFCGNCDAEAVARTDTGTPLCETCRTAYEWGGGETQDL